MGIPHFGDPLSHFNHGFLCFLFNIHRVSFLFQTVVHMPNLKKQLRCSHEVFTWGVHITLTRTECTHHVSSDYVGSPDGQPIRSALIYTSYRMLNIVPLVKRIEKQWLHQWGIHTYIYIHPCNQDREAALSSVLFVPLLRATFFGEL